MPSRWNLAYRFDVVETYCRRTERNLGRLVDAVTTLADATETRFNRLERLIVTSFAAQMTDLDLVTNAIADGYVSRDALIAEMRDALANKDLVKAQALAAQDVEHANAVQLVVERLRGLGRDPQNPVPDTTPLPTPETPAPLVPPADEPAVVEPVPSPGVPVVEPDAPLAVPSPGEPSDVGPVDDTVIGEPGDERA